MQIRPGKEENGIFDFCALARDPQQHYSRRCTRMSRDVLVVYTPYEVYIILRNHLVVKLVAPGKNNCCCVCVFSSQ